MLDLDLPLPGAQQVAQVLSEDPETKTIPMIYAVGAAQPPAQLPPHVELLQRGAAPATLPALAAQMIAAARARAKQVPTLLIVDDDADIQRILTLRLQQDGYRVARALTGAEALSATQKQSFDLIILDLLLPDIDGFAVLAALRAHITTDAPRYVHQWRSGDIVCDPTEIVDAQWYRRDELPAIPPRISIARKLIDTWLDG